MAASWEGVVLSLLLALCCALALRRRRKSSEGGKRLPPGPTPWPFVGNMFQLSPMLHECFGDLAKTFGPLVFARLGSTKVLVACNAEMAKAVLKVRDAEFSSRPHNTASIGIITFDFNDFIMLRDGGRWRQLKKILVTELLSTKRLATFQPGRTGQMVTMLRSVKRDSEAGQEINLRETLYQCFSNIITIMISNKVYFGPQSSLKERRELFDAIRMSLRLFGSFNPGDYFPFLKPFDVLGVERKARMCKDRLFKFCQKIVQDHRDHRLHGASYVEDFVDILLSCPGFEGEERLSDQTIIAIMVDIMIAGTETSISTTEFALAELIRNPKLMRNAQEELDSVVGRDRFVKEEDVPNLPYLNAILRENFRCHPVVPAGVPHVSPKGGCQLAGYYIPEDTMLLVNAWAIGRDPASWDRPDEFDPERFLGTNPRDVKGQDFELIPFGAGRRMCTGFNLALIVTHVTLAHLLHSFNWRLPDGQTPESLDFRSSGGFVGGMMKPPKLIASPRLPSAAYTSVF